MVFDRLIVDGTAVFPNFCDDSLHFAIFLLKGVKQEIPVFEYGWFCWFTSAFCFFHVKWFSFQNSHIWHALPLRLYCLQYWILIRVFFPIFGCTHTVQTVVFIWLSLKASNLIIDLFKPLRKQDRIDEPLHPHYMDEVSIMHHRLIFFIGYFSNQNMS